MIKLLKFLAALVLLLVVAAVFASYLIDSDDFKSRVESAFASATGRQLVIAGHLRISLAPKLALEVTDVSVPEAFGTRGPDRVAADKLRIYPRLSPLLRGRLVLGSVRVDGGRLEWTQDGQGKTDLGDRPSYSRWLAIDDLEGVAGPIGAGEPVAFHLNGLVGGRDGETPARLRAEGELVIADPRRLQLDALTVDLQGLQVRKGLAADLVLHTSLDADHDARRYLTDGLALDIHAFGEALAGGRIEARAGARVELDLGAGSLMVSDFRLRSGGLSATGASRGRDLLSSPLVEGNLVVDELDLRAWLRQQGLPIPAMADAETFRRFSLSTNWHWKGDRYVFEDLVVRVDQTRLTGKAERIATSPPGYRFDLVADRMDLDRYLQPSQRTRAKSTRKQRMPKAASEPAVSKGPVAEQLSSEQPASSKPTTGTDAETRAATPLTDLSRVTSLMGTISEPDLEGRLHIGDLVLARLRFGDVDLGLRGKEGRLDIQDQMQSFYGGRLDGSLGLDLDDVQPSLALQQRADRIRMGPLLADLVGEERLTGRGKITADLRARGLTANVLRRSLAGNLTLEVPKGVLEGINLETLVREADARLNGKPPPEDLPTSTDFEDLRASGQIEQGVLHNQDLTLRTEYLRVTGAGTLDLVQERFDYRFEPVLVKPPKGRSIKELEGIPIPVHLTGPFAHPRWDVDLSKALRAVAQKRVGDQGGTLFHELEKRTHIKGLEQGLKSLLGQ
jgi:AsmA protein